MQIIILLLAIVLWPQHVTARTDLHSLFPDSELAGWVRAEEPRQYSGDELFQMIDGGADIYLEYGFSQVLAGDFENAEGKYIRLEIYEMTSPEAAYGIYTFKTGPHGKSLDLGQSALLEEYYLNIWMGNLLVTIVGSDPDQAIVDDVIALGKFLDERCSQHGGVPKLAQLLSHGYYALENVKYVLGTLGAMNSYIFDTDDIFEVREGVIGMVEGSKAFVFRYPEEDASSRVFGNVTARFETGSRFNQAATQGDICSMIDRNEDFIVVRRAGRNIITVIGKDREQSATLAEQLDEKLSDF